MKEKGTIKVIPIIFASAIIVAVVIFFTVFANPLLGKAMEKGLEAIFQAKADVRGFRLSLIDFEISVRSITVANRDSPMLNLFDMGKTGIKLKPQAILRGKVYIEWIKADTIRFGTPRTVSGALPARPPKEKPEKPPKPESPPLIDLKNFDAMALINQEFDKLNTPRLYDDAINTYNETAAKWQGQVEDTTARVAELRTVTTPLINLNVGDLRDADAIRTAISDLNTAVNTVQAATNDVSVIVSGLETDINTARRLETNARNSITDDINHLRSYIDLGSGSAFAALEPFIREMLSDTAEEYIEYGLMALEVLERLKAEAAAKPKDEKPKKEKKVVFKGRDVHYPVAAYPAFYLGLLSSDFTLDSWKWDFNLKNVSSSPDITNRPVSLDIDLSETGENLKRNINFTGSADFRTDPQELFNAKLSGSGFPVSLGDKLSNVGINGLDGEIQNMSISLSSKDNSISGGGEVILGNARIIDPSGTIAEAVDTAVRQADSINLGIEYIQRPDERDIFNITTNIANLIAQALRNTAETYARTAMADIERALRQKIDEYIDGRFGSKDQVDTLMRTARGDSAAIGQIKNSLDAKKDELEQRLRSMVGGAAQQAGQQAEQAIRDNLPGNLPTLPGGLRR